MKGAVRFKLFNARVSFLLLFMWLLGMHKFCFYMYATSMLCSLHLPLYGACVLAYWLRSSHLGNISYMKQTSGNMATM